MSKNSKCHHIHLVAIIQNTNTNNDNKSEGYFVYWTSSVKLFHAGHEGLAEVGESHCSASHNESHVLAIKVSCPKSKS